MEGLAEKGFGSEQLAEIYDLIDREETTEVTVKEFFHYRELYVWFLAPAVILLLTEIMMMSLFVRRLP